MIEREIEVVGCLHPSYRNIGVPFRGRRACPPPIPDGIVDGFVALGWPICASRDAAGGGASTIEVFGYPQCILRRGEVIPVHSSAFYLVAR